MALQRYRVVYFTCLHCIELKGIALRCIALACCWRGIKSYTLYAYIALNWNALHCITLACCCWVSSQALFWIALPEDALNYIASHCIAFVREILPPPTAWMLDLLDLTLRLGPLVRSWLSFSFHTWPSVAARVQFCNVLVCSDTIWQIWGFTIMNYINSFITDCIAFLSLDMTITGKLKSVGCRRSARVVLVDFPGCMTWPKLKRCQHTTITSGLMSTSWVRHRIAQDLRQHMTFA